MIGEVDVGGTARVLVVDDDPAIREALRALLEDAGYAVDEARDGEAALALLTERTIVPYVVLTDHQMPRLDGARMLRRIASDPALVARHAYLLMTASNRHADPEVRRTLAALDAPIIRKPFDLDEIVAAVDTAARRIGAMISYAKREQGRTPAHL